MTPERDVLIVGGGMVGAALGCLLATRGFTVAVIERGEVPGFSLADEIDLRVSAIAPGSRRVLAAVGAWETMQAARISPYRGMHVWQSGAAGPAAAIHFDAADLGEPDLGAIVENRLVRHALVQRLRALPQARWWSQAILRSVRPGEGGTEAVLEDGRRIVARLVVAADGARSGLRELAGIGTRGRDYRQHAVVTHVRSARAHGEIARQRFLPDGPLALLPLADGRSSVVWATRPEDAEVLLGLDDAAFGERITAASEEVLGALVPAAPRAAFPLRLQFAERYTAARLVLVGDAAHSVHPLAGLGVNLGFADAAALAEVLEDALAAGEDIGDAPVLRRYERWRKGENLLAMAMLDGLQRLFASSHPLVGRLRAGGLGIVERNALLKNRFARRAMGLEGDLPRLLRATSV